jgi:hypothetical protein
MTPKYLQACKFFTPAEKACWEVLARERMSRTTLTSSTDELAAAIAGTLEQLWDLLSAASVERWLRTHPAGFAGKLTSVGCGVTVLVDFFEAGEDALKLVLAEIEHGQSLVSEFENAQHHEEIRRALEILAQREIQVLCGECHLNPDCSLHDRTRPSIWRSEKVEPAAAIENRNYRRQTVSAASPEEVLHCEGEIPRITTRGRVNPNSVELD